LPLAWDHALSATRFRCHYKLTSIFTAVMADLFNHTEAWASINDFGGCYEFRKQRGASVLSRHAWGIAIDLDVGDNPFGKTPKVHPVTLEVFTNHGFVWGGTFPLKRRDGMHFEFADLSRLS
jgi:hypothetical protein